MKIGLSLESLNLPFRRALERAEQFGVSGVIFNAIGQLSAANLSQTGRRDCLRMIRNHQLELAALGCPLRYGLDTVENMEARIAYVQQAMSLAYDLGTRIVLIQSGAVPESEDDPRFGVMRESLSALGTFGDRCGVTLALETGLDSGEMLSQFIDRFDTGSLAVNFDPANQLMHGFKPIEDMNALAGKIVHVQAKDARKVSASRSAQEVALGHGDLDWMLMCQMLDESEYRGYLTIIRESGDRRLQDVQEGVGFLRRFV